MWIVEIENNIWLAKGSGITWIKENAMQYKSRTSAKSAITKARKYKPFSNAVIEFVYPKY